MPGPPGSEGDEPPPAGTAPAPSVGVTGDVPHDERDGLQVIFLGLLSIARGDIFDWPGRSKNGVATARLRRQREHSIAT